MRIRSYIRSASEACVKQIGALFWINSPVLHAPKLPERREEAEANL
jgi:hypothetical protein